MIKSIVGGILIVLGAFLLLGITVNIAESGLSVDYIVGGVLFGIGPIAGGGLLIRSHVKAKRNALVSREKDEYARREKEIIRLAQQKAGRLSIPEIVAETSLSTAEADQMMRDMTSKGYVEMQVTDSGIIMYEFYEIAHRKPLDE